MLIHLCSIRLWLYKLLACHSGKDGKKKKVRSGSNSGSKPGSRSSTPIQNDQTSSETLSQAVKSLKEGIIVMLCNKDLIPLQ